MNIVEKMIKEHLISGKMVPGEEIAIKIDQTLTQDATGTMAYLQFESLGIPKVKTKLSVSYIDHNTLQDGFENFDDHKYLQSVAAKYGVIFSKAGNGICHQVHLERFGIPGETLLGSDSHTPTAGGLGMLAIGCGGLDVAVAMAGDPFYLTMPNVIKINLIGKLKPCVSAKDIILEILRMLKTKGNVGWVVEYGGDGVKNLTVPERATITNMGAELGVTASIFPSDELTRKFLKAEKRDWSFKKLEADKDARYERVIDIDLNNIEPLIALPHSPDNVKKVKDVEGIKVDQVIIGSCTNSSYKDLMTVASFLKGKKVSSNLSFVIAPGSRQVLTAISKNGALTTLINAGARIVESACGFCIGAGQAPPTNGVSLRTSNRNFEGRSGTKSASVYLVSPETGVASAIKGVITDPRKLAKSFPKIKTPDKFFIDDTLILKPSKNPENIKICRGPNIGEPLKTEPMSDILEGVVLLKVGDNTTTDHIMPAGTRLKYRSNIQKYSDFVFEGIAPNFSKKAKESGGGFIVGGLSYGQGSSREHAAICPKYLGIKVVIAKSFERIHTTNLINFGILPLTFADENDYERISENDILKISDARNSLKKSKEIIAENITKNTRIKLLHNLTSRQIDIILAGGLLNYIV